MARSLRTHGYLGLLTAVLACSGCVGPLATILYVFGGEGDIKADYTGLKNKRVAVVCQSMSQLSINELTVPKDLAKQVADHLKANDKKVTVISHREVDQWIDEHGSEDYVAIGKGLKADMVIGVDLESFKTYQGPTLYRGQANCTIAVYDIKQNGEKVWSRRMPKILFPPNSEVPAAGITERDFRDKFMTRLGELVARHFYDHALADDFANDGID